MTPEELVNLALSEEIEIEVTGKLPTIHLLESDLTPFEPLQTRKIPLYIAIFLSKSNICKIRLPNFLKIDFLDLLIDKETELENEYCKIYNYIFELTDILLDISYNVEDKELIRLKVEQLRNLRKKKTVEGLKLFDGQAFNINNLTNWELNEVMPFIKESGNLLFNAINENIEK